VKVKPFESRVVWGILLILAGGMLFLQNFGVFDNVLELFWALLFAGGGAIFIFLFLTNREHWWAVIPGFSLLGIGGLIFLDQFLPKVSDAVGGSFFLGAVGLSFWFIFLLKREHWWAIIPGGALFTLAAVAGIDSLWPGVDEGGIFFLGLGLTFGLVSIVPTPQGRMKWALIPAGILFVMGLLISAATLSLMKWVWALGLIVVGVLLILRTLISR